MRPAKVLFTAPVIEAQVFADLGLNDWRGEKNFGGSHAVSYTHLTLPTIYSV